MTSMVSRFFLAVASILAVASGAITLMAAHDYAFVLDDSRAKVAVVDESVARGTLVASPRGPRSGAYVASRLPPDEVEASRRDAVSRGQRWYLALADRGSSETYGFADEGFEAGLFACLVCIG